MPRGRGTGVLREATRRMRSGTPTAGSTTTATDGGTQKTISKKPPHYEVVLWLGRFTTWCKRRGMISEEKSREFQKFTIDFLREDYPPADPWAASRATKSGGEAGPTCEAERSE